MRAYKQGFLNYQQFFDPSKLRELEYICKSKSLVVKVSLAKLSQALENYPKEYQIFCQQRDDILLG